MANRTARRSSRVVITESENKVLLFTVGLIVGVSSAAAALKQWYEYSIPAILAAIVVLWLLNK